MGLREEREILHKVIEETDCTHDDETEDFDLHYRIEETKNVGE